MYLELVRTLQQPKVESIYKGGLVAQHTEENLAEVFCPQLERKTRNEN